MRFSKRIQFATLLTSGYWKRGKKTDEGGIFVALLIDLLKTSDFLLRNQFKIMLHV